MLTAECEQLARRVGLALTMITRRSDSKAAMIRSAVATPTHRSNGNILLDPPAEGSETAVLHNEQLGTRNRLVSILLKIE